MAEQETQVSEQAAPVEAIEAPPSATPQSPDIPLTDEALEGYLARASHDDLKKYPSYNRQLQRLLTKERQRVQQEQAVDQQRTSQLRQFDTYFRTLQQTNPQQFMQEMEDPQRLAAWQQVVEARRNGWNGTALREEDVANRIWKNFRQILEEDEAFGGIDLDTLEANEKEAPRILYGLAKEITQRERKKMETDFQKWAKNQLAVMLQEELTKRNLQISEEEAVPGAAVGSAAGIPTREQYASMSPEDRAKARASGDLDRWSRRWMGL